MLLASLCFLFVGCTEELPEAAGDISWLIENGAIDDAPESWELTESRISKGFTHVEGEAATRAEREYVTDQSAVEISEAVTETATNAGWEIKSSGCWRASASLGFEHPGKGDVFLTVGLKPVDGRTSILVKAVFDRPQWFRVEEGAQLESLECFDDVVHRVELAEKMGPLVSLEPEEIQTRLTEAEVAEIFGRATITSRLHDGRRVQYLDGDEFVLVVQKLYSSAVPELDGFGRDDIYLIEETHYNSTYRVGLGDASVEVANYTETDPQKIDRVKTALLN